MGARWQRLVAESSRFLAVGGVATVVAFALFNLLAHQVQPWWDPPLHEHPIWAYVIANTVGMVISYRGTRSWAFRHRVPLTADGGRVAYVVINVVTMGVPVACLWISRNLLGLSDPLSDNISANVVGLGLGTLARFHLFRRFVFVHPHRTGRRDAPTG